MPKEAKTHHCGMCCCRSRLVCTVVVLELEVEGWGKESGGEGKPRTERECVYVC